MTIEDRFGRQCPVCGQRIHPDFLPRHLEKRHPDHDARKLLAEMERVRGAAQERS